MFCYIEFSIMFQNLLKNWDVAFMCREKNCNVKEAKYVSIKMVLLSPLKFDALSHLRFLLYSYVANAECFYPVDNISECKD